MLTPNQRSQAESRSPATTGYVVRDAAGNVRRGWILAARAKPVLAKRGSSPDGLIEEVTIEQVLQGAKDAGPAATHCRGNSDAERPS